MLSIKCTRVGVENRVVMGDRNNKKHYGRKTVLVVVNVFRTRCGHYIAVLVCKLLETHTRSLLMLPLGMHTEQPPTLHKCACIC